MPDHPTPQCRSVCLMGDDRGDIACYCELPIGHDGPHQDTLNACSPPAVMIWENVDVVPQPTDATEMTNDEFERRIAQGTPVTVSVPQNPFMRPTTAAERERDTYVPQPTDAVTTKEPNALIMERTMFQWWCYVCRQWVGTPKDTRYDVADHVISQHLGGHISDGTL